MEMNKKYAIFDMDGTLVDSMPWWQGLAKEYLLKEGVEEISPEVLEKIRPLTITESAVLFKEIYGIQGTPEEMAAKVNGLMAEHYKKDIPLKPGVREYLAGLKEQGVKMCVASATAEHLMEACLKRLDVRDDFEFLLSCEEVGAGKHSPDVYHLAAEKLGASPVDTAVYEDALHAVQTAKQAGFYVIGIYDESMKDNWKEICALADEVMRDWEDEA
mgnify:FL=1